MTTLKLTPGEQLPQFDVQLLGGGSTPLGVPTEGKTWRVIIVYRGKHCGVCTLYLGALNKIIPELDELDVELVAVSGDTAEKANDQMQKVDPRFDIAYGLTTAQMKELGLFISTPRSAQETDTSFSEPGLFVVDQKGIIQIIDISNFPFMRPDLEWLVKGIRFALNPENEYPIRGTQVV